LADRGERYLDTIYSSDWINEHFGDVSHLWRETPELEQCAWKHPDQPEVIVARSN
jgi:hypothetical protein